MNGRGVTVDKSDGFLFYIVKTEGGPGLLEKNYRDAVQSPFCSFLGEGFPTGVPRQRCEALGGNINICFRLDHTQPPCRVRGYRWLSTTYFYSIEDLDNAGMSKSPKLAESIAG